VVPVGVGTKHLSNRNYQFPGLQKDARPYRLRMAGVIYWPLEQLDRRARPEEWKSGDFGRELLERWES
jgi:hypothetical protein